MSNFDHGFVFGQRTTPKNKAIETQVGAHFTPGVGWNTQWGSDYVGGWADYASPMPPVVDADGNVSAGCEVLFTQLGDDIKSLGQRDVRWSKYFQDAQPGDAGKINAFGSRLALHKNYVALSTSGGAFIGFDITKRKVSLSGFPNSATQAAYLTIGLTSIGLVSPAGAGSLTVSDNGVTLNGKSATIAAGKVLLGLGAAGNGVITAANLAAYATALDAWIAAVAAALTALGHAVPAFPSVTAVQASKTVFSGL